MIDIKMEGTLGKNEKAAASIHPQNAQQRFRMDVS